VAIAIPQFRDKARRYLGFHGAQVDWVDDIAGVDLAAAAWGRGERQIDVVVLGMTLGDAQIQEIRERFSAHAQPRRVRFVRVVQGRRLSVRQANADTIVVDATPMRRIQFIRAVAVSVGRASPEIKPDTGPDDAARTGVPTVEEAEANGQLILVAEDNLTNRNVIRRQLNMLGYAADIVEDGRQALDALGLKRYALLLTDCHMPNMDGYELTQAIRADEDALDSRFPIIAVTANALQGEAERCFEVGMDDYLSKPIEMDLLKQKLRKWMPVPLRGPSAPTPAPAIEEPEAPSAAAGGNGPVDPAALHELFGDDDAAIREILDAFIEPSAVNVRDILNAYKARSAKTVGASAHKLKGSSAAIGARSLADLCLRLEMAGKSENWQDLEAAAPLLEGAFAEVVAYIEQR
jgi:CheY-like chemotaxis protein/HPt (histidine-containing phosphotransfer) domain-containing protein